MTPKARAQEAMDALHKWEAIDGNLSHKAREFRCYQAALFLDNNLAAIREALEKHAAAVKRGEG